MINKLVFENIKFRWVRTFLSALVVGVQVMSILTLIGLSRGMLEDSANRVRGTGADIILRPDSGGSMQFASGQIDEKFVNFVAQQPHVREAVGMLSQSVQVVTFMNGVNFDEFRKLNGNVHFIDGHPPQGPNDLIVDRYYADQNKYHVGQNVTLLNHQWIICGVIDSGFLSRLIVPLRTLQRLTGNSNPPKLTQIAVKLDNPSLTDEVVTQLNAKLRGNLQALSMEAMVSQYSVSKLPPLQAFIAVITILSVLVGFLVVFLSMYTAVVERTREIGILKALGASPGTIINILVREALCLAFVGWALGVLLSFATKSLIMALVPASLQVVIVPDWWPKAALIAFGGAILGAIYPGLRAARQDAIEALAYD